MKPAEHLLYVERLTEILENEKDILFAYLFGSYAKGTQDERSDIDIAVYLADESILERDHLYPSMLVIQIEDIIKKKVDVSILNGSTLRFRNQVLMYGKLLHSKDEKKRIEFETSSLTQYLDFKPHIDIYDAARRKRLGV